MNQRSQSTSVTSERRTDIIGIAAQRLLGIALATE